MPDDPTFVQESSPISLHTFRYFYPQRHQKLAYGSGILPNLQRQPLLYFQIPFFLTAMAAKLCRLCHLLQPSMIHAHWIFPQGTIANLVGRRLGIPVIVTAHGGDAFALQGNFLNHLKQWTLNHATAWTSNTSKTAEAVHATNRPCIIPMGVDYNLFSQAIPLKKNRKRIILFVGRLVEKKGVSYLIEAFAQLDSHLRNQCSLWIVGDGLEKRNLENMAQRLGTASQIRFWGRIPHEKLPSFYASADLFVAPSITDRMGDTEGQGVVFLEAMASGTPVIATRSGGISEVIEDGIEGLLVEPSNPTQLCASITTLLQDDQRRRQLAQKGQQKARTYDWSVIGQHFVALYQSMTGCHTHKTPSTGTTASNSAITPVPDP